MNFFIDALTVDPSFHKREIFRSDEQSVPVIWMRTLATMCFIYCLLSVRPVIGVTKAVEFLVLYFLYTLAPSFFLIGALMKASMTAALEESLTRAIPCRHGSKT